MRKVVLLLILNLFLLFNVKAQICQAEYNLKIPLSRHFVLKTGSAVRTKEQNFPQIKTVLFENSLNFEASKRIDLAIGYRYSLDEGHEEPSFNLEEDKRRINFDFSYDLPIVKKPYDLDYRLRVQQSRKSGDQDKFYLRNKLSFQYKLHDLFQPYTSHEIYYDFNNHTFRFFKSKIGMETSPCRRLKFDMYMTNEISFKSGYAKESYLIGVSVDIKLF